MLKHHNLRILKKWNYWPKPVIKSSIIYQSF